MYKKLLLITLLGLFALNYVYAEETTVSPTPTSTNEQKNKIIQERKELLEQRKDELNVLREQAQQKRSEWQEKKDELVGQRCEVITKHIDNRLERALENRERHEEFYKNAKQRLDQLVAKLKSKGYDTTSLEAELKVMADLIATLADKHSIFITKLEATKDYVCGESEGQFKTALEEARTALLEVRKAAVSVREHFITKIKPLISDIRDQLRSSSEEESNE